MPITAEEAATILKPQIKTCLQANDDQKWDILEGFYHPNGVVVQKNQESIYGNKAIIAFLSKSTEITGKCTSTISNVKYEGTGDYLIITANFSAETEKVGTVKGKFLQIWKKEGDRHLIYHDEFEVLT